jgi:hypothetical protein
MKIRIASMNRRFCPKRKSNMGLSFSIQYKFYARDIVVLWIIGCRKDAVLEGFRFDLNGMT